MLAIPPFPAEGREGTAGRSPAQGPAIPAIWQLGATASQSPSAIQPAASPRNANSPRPAPRTRGVGAHWAFIQIDVPGLSRRRRHYIRITPPRPASVSLGRPRPDGQTRPSWVAARPTPLSSQDLIFKSRAAGPGRKHRKRAPARHSPFRSGRELKLHQCRPNRLAARGAGRGGGCWANIADGAGGVAVRSVASHPR